MPMPPLEFLFDASTKSLEDLELAALNRAANLSKSMRVELDAWVEQLAEAMFVRWVKENRETLRRPDIIPKRAIEFLSDLQKRA